MILKIDTAKKCVGELDFLYGPLLYFLVICGTGPFFFNFRRRADARGRELSSGAHCAEAV